MDAGVSRHCFHPSSNVRPEGSAVPRRPRVRTMTAAAPQVRCHVVVPYAMSGEGCRLGITYKMCLKSTTRTLILKALYIHKKQNFVVSIMTTNIPGPIFYVSLEFAPSLFSPCSANQRSRYVSNGFAVWLSKEWASSEQAQIGDRKWAPTIPLVMITGIPRNRDVLGLITNGPSLIT